MVFDVMEPSCTEGNEFSALEYMLDGCLEVIPLFGQMDRGSGLPPRFQTPRQGVKMVSEVLGMSRSTAYYCPNGRVCHRLQSVNLFV